MGRASLRPQAASNSPRMKRRAAIDCWRELAREWVGPPFARKRPPTGTKQRPSPASGLQQAVGLAVVMGSAGAQGVDEVGGAVAAQGLDELLAVFGLFGVEGLGGADDLELDAVCAQFEGRGIQAFEDAREYVVGAFLRGHRQDRQRDVLELAAQGAEQVEVAQV